VLSWALEKFYLPSKKKPAEILILLREIGYSFIVLFFEAAKKGGTMTRQNAFTYNIYFTNFADVL